MYWKLQGNKNLVGVETLSTHSLQSPQTTMYKETLLAVLSDPAYQHRIPKALADQADSLQLLILAPNTKHLQSNKATTNMKQLQLQSPSFNTELVNLISERKQLFPFFVCLTCFKFYIVLTTSCMIANGNYLNLQNNCLVYSAKRLTYSKRSTFVCRFFLIPLITFDADIWMKLLYSCIRLLSTDQYPVLTSASD